MSYAPGLRDGQAVIAGQLLGFVGDSGDANGGPTHLHFELHPHDGAAVSPYKWLRSATRPLFPLRPGDKERGTSAAATLTLTGTVVKLAAPPATQPPPSDEGGGGTGGSGSGGSGAGGAASSSGSGGNGVPPPPPPPPARGQPDVLPAGSRLTIHVSLVVVSTGGRYSVTRNVTLTVSPALVFQRAGGGAARASALVKGAKLTVTTAALRLDSGAQLAKAGVLPAATIALAG
jgi:hypothetical protein